MKSLAWRNGLVRIVFNTTSGRSHLKRGHHFISGSLHKLEMITRGTNAIDLKLDIMSSGMMPPR